MRNALYYLAIGISSLLLLSGCKKEKLKRIEFEMPYIDYFTVPKTTTYLIPYTINSKEAPTNSAEQFTQHKTSAEKVKEVKLTRFRLAIVSPAGKDFKFLESVKISLESDGLPLTEVANKYDIDPGIGNVLDLDILDKDLQEFMKQPYFRMRAEVKAKANVDEPLEVKSDISFNVIAEPL